MAMKLISLNIWGGVINDPLVDFLNKYKNEVDIFCFQEVYKSDEEIRNQSQEKIVTFKDLIEIFRDFNGYFEDYVAPGDYGKQGLAVFLKKKINVKDKGEIF